MTALRHLDGWDELLRHGVKEAKPRSGLFKEKPVSSAKGLQNKVVEFGKRKSKQTVSNNGGPKGR